jgi:hypothetical protein
MLAFILWGFFAYMMYVFLKNFVMPIVKVFWKIKKQMNTIKKNYNTNNPEPEEQHLEKKAVNHPAFQDEYIDFEEVRKK